MSRCLSTASSSSRWPIESMMTSCDMIWWYVMIWCMMYDVWFDHMIWFVCVYCVLKHLLLLFRTQERIQAAARICSSRSCSFPRPTVPRSAPLLADIFWSCLPSYWYNFAFSPPSQDQQFFPWITRWIKPKYQFPISNFHLSMSAPPSRGHLVV